ncbi:hypothetical protein BBW65_03605 [Helicobacter enhydrae]|uniref:Uncharacterized protein n=1 Tax=Helicobacter enhydrae TaxID=222136 RepID=A0A1B1U5A4_9HELI|nr:hypothetical protein BBW65_03605 [Helicobacter enhydrae]
MFSRCAFGLRLKYLQDYNKCPNCLVGCKIWCEAFCYIIIYLIRNFGTENRIATYFHICFGWIWIPAFVAY